MRQKIAAGNWKMNLTLPEARQLTQEIKHHKIPKDVNVILGCPSPFLYMMNSLVEKTDRLNIAAQNCNNNDSGAYTGEVSHSMLSSVGVNYVIIGHSERREYFNESNKLLKEKINTLIANGFKIIFCCGEPLKIRKAKTQSNYVLNQLQQSLFHLTSDEMKQIIIAYEPIWAIGTGLTASPAQAQQMHSFIRKQLNSKYGKATSEATSILYGGSVKPGNAKELFSMKDVDGGLVGGASLKPEMFKNIINAF